MGLITILSSSLLIVLMLLLRTLFRHTVRQTVIYALWGLVLLRLLIPVPLLSMPGFLIVPDGVVREGDEWEAALREETEEEDAPSEELMTEDVTGYISEYTSEHYSYDAALEMYDYEPVSQASEDNMLGTDETDLTDAGVGVDGSDTELTRQQRLTEWRTVWLSVAAALFVIVLISNLIMGHRLRKNRLLIDAEKRPYIYRTTFVAVPCLYGLVRPSIYLPPEEAEDGTRRDYILRHERMHYRHLDHIWSALRILAVCLHWFNPLVWIAARVSRQDAELAVDEAVTRRLSQEERIEYGTSILHTLRNGHRKNRLLSVAGTACSSKREMKKRIKNLARERRYSLPALMILLVIGCVLTVCAFGGKRLEPSEDSAADTPVGSESSVTGESVAGSPEELADDVDEEPKLPGISLPEDLEAAVSKSLIERAYFYLTITSAGPFPHDIAVESHVVLANEEKDGQTQVTLVPCMVFYGYDEEEKSFSPWEVRGSMELTTITFQKNEDGSYEETDYAAPINNIIVKKVFDDSYKEMHYAAPAESVNTNVYYAVLRAQCHTKALQQYKKSEQPASRRQAESVHKIKEADMVTVYTPEGKANQYLRSECPGFVDRLVAAYNNMELRPVEKQENVSLTVSHAISIYYSYEYDSVAEIVLDPDAGVCWLDGKPYVYRMVHTFDGEQIRQFVRSQTKKSQDGFHTYGFFQEYYSFTVIPQPLELLDWEHDNKLLDEIMLLSESEGLEDSIEWRAKVLSEREGLPLEDVYEVERDKIIRMHEEYLASSVSPEKKAERTVRDIKKIIESQDMLTDDNAGTKHLEEYCQTLGITTEQYWEYVKKLAKI